jgi:hypothetical protein
MVREAGRNGSRSKSYSATVLQALARHHTHLQTKAAQDSSNAQFYVNKPPETFLARNKQCSPANPSIWRAPDGTNPSGSAGQAPRASLREGD